VSGPDFDIAVVGGGHAGLEAALACARLGARTALITHDAREIGRMPCNPAIGGLGKGHLVREIDVLGGEMGLAIDQSGIQFRVLNRKKGPAVQSPRAQADKHQYQRLMSAVVEQQAGLTVIEGDGTGILVHQGRVTGVTVSTGQRVSAARVVLCTGTFLKGLMHVGERQSVGGREGAASSESLSSSLLGLGFQLRRLKTGTPPRLAAGTIDYGKLVPQPGDNPPQPFSFRTGHFDPQQIQCHLAYTNEHTHQVIEDSLGRSPLFGGAIAGRGPRYCPSIEDKVVRFADKDRHLLFLEPEGRHTNEVYVNGLSTSLPADVQEKFVHSVEGLERAEIIRFGYAIEYDSVPSWQVHRSLESKLVAGLYLAGQLLGTSGYEEAAAQGLYAGVNAVLGLDGKDPLRVGRDQAYLGVLVDDLVTKEIDEPYRMFTSRAEHRLHLRCDNTESRLLPLSRRMGLLPGVALANLEAREVMVGAVMELLRRTRVISPERESRVSAAEFLKFPGETLQTMRSKTQVPADFWDKVDFETNNLLNKTDSPRLVAAALFQIETDIRYEGYISKHKRLLSSQEHLDNYELPKDLDYMSLTALSYEAREKLNRIKPDTLGQASRIDGVRAGDQAVLVVYLKRWREADKQGGAV